MCRDLINADPPLDSRPRNPVKRRPCVAQHLFLSKGFRQRGVAAGSPPGRDAANRLFVRHYRTIVLAQVSHRATPVGVDPMAGVTIATHNHRTCCYDDNSPLRPRRLDGVDAARRRRRCAADLQGPLPAPARCRAKIRSVRRRRGRRSERVGHRVGGVDAPSVDVLRLHLQRQAVLDDLLHPHLLRRVERQLQEREHSLAVAGPAAGEQHRRVVALRAGGPSP